jgi:hypothetical protein
MILPFGSGIRGNQTHAQCRGVRSSVGASPIRHRSADRGSCPKLHRLRPSFRSSETVIERGTLVFDGFLGARDMGAIEMDVGSFSQQNDSEFLALLVERNYEKRPDDLDWTHFRFLDVEDSVIFEVVAPSCSFVGSDNSQPTDDG